MNRRNIMIALGALVAGAFALVYAGGEKRIGQQSAAATSSSPDVSVTGATPAAPQAAPQVSYDFNALPDPVNRMLTAVAGAAESGNIEAMRPVFESNELSHLTY